MRRVVASLGLPVAYLLNLLLIHVPGAIAHLLDSNHILVGREYTAAGIAFTAIGSVMFVAGVAIVHFRAPVAVPVAVPRSTYWKFCLVGGWACTAVGFLFNIPSIGAVMIRGGFIWMLGVMLALDSALRRHDTAMGLRWLVALIVYPLLMLLVGGFLGNGVIAVSIVLAILAIHVRSTFRVAATILLACLLGISLFLSYFEHRQEIRSAVWGGASADVRIAASMDAVKGATVFDSRNDKHLKALDARLNQNYFAGLAAARIAAGKVDYLNGRSLLDGFIALVPRALWPEKPVVAGSPKIVSEMTGLHLSEGTSFGVGNVMEFQINFGIPGLIFGFLALGLAIGWLDRRAASMDLTGRLDVIPFYFLPAVALIQPNGSMVEMIGGAASGLAAAIVWRWLWQRVPRQLPLPVTTLDRASPNFR